MAENLPVVAINFKAYSTAFGSKGLAIAKAADEVAKELKGLVKVVIAVPATEVYRISTSVEEVVVYGQHADPIEPGAHTGYIPVEALKEAGARGVLLNHSEHKLILSDLVWLITKARKLGLETIVCADNNDAAAAVAALKPDYIAVEPPELIGTGIPVSKAKPEVITSSVEAVRRIAPVPVLAGAGITRGEDVEAAIRLGSVGVLVASAVMKASDPKAKIRELVEAAHRAWKR